MTIEEPIEYELSSLGIPISQSQVNLKKGVNFANGLRHILALRCIGSSGIGRHRSWLSSTISHVL